MNMLLEVHLHTHVCMCSGPVYARICMCVCVCLCVCVSVRARSNRAVLMCDVCTPGSVGGQQGTFTVRPRPVLPRVIRFSGGGTGDKARVKH